IYAIVESGHPSIRISATKWLTVETVSDPIYSLSRLDSIIKCTPSCFAQGDVAWGSNTHT
ncbi:MAG TPA: hypothetical protein VET30_08335, partial [Pseudoxanthomonas sp.]|nr:hypothetical protein [Pseudoxanthomonas sp.]